MFVTVGEFLEAAVKTPLWLFLDSILSTRFTGLYRSVCKFTDSITEFCPDCTSIQRTHMAILFFCATIISILAISLHTVGLWILSSIILALITAWTASVVYALLLHVVSNPWLGSDGLVQSLIQQHFILAALLAACTLIYFLSQTQVNYACCARAIFLSTLSFVIALIAYFPLMLHFPGEVFTDYCLSNALGPNPTSPAWFAYAHVLLSPPDPALASHIPPDLFVSLLRAQHDEISSGALPASSIAYPQICPAALNPTCVVRESFLIRLFVKANPYALLASYLSLIWLWIRLAPFTQRLKVSIVQEVELYEALGFFGFLTFHWNRLNIPLVLAMLWACKLTLVVVMGPQVWPVLPDQPESVLMDLNITSVNDFNQPPENQSDLALLWNRIYVGAVVHCSETWLVVFGAAAFFSAVATLVVHLLILLLDPSGEDTRQLIAAAGDAPLNLHDWNVIEDPALALDQHDVLAVEMLAGTSWNCAVVFLFLAFQYDLPTLPLAQRICCSLYGLIVIAISCIHPVQALIKSLLLHLGVPGRDNSWFTHLRLLFFCILLICSSICVLTYVPEGLAERVSNHTQLNDTLYVNRPDSTSSDPNASSVLVPRFGSSFVSLKARQLRIVLCGCQLLLGLVVTLIEYVIYQISRRHPEWNGFRPSLFWTKLISSVLDYLISLMSFLTVCWLSIYDSIGLCRLLIICCYFYFILYPSAATAYTWLRWRLLARQGIEHMTSPTKERLEQYQDDCPICYTTMTTENAKVTQCGHLYHTECLATWMRRQLFCPICHADLLSTKARNRHGETPAAAVN